MADTNTYISKQKVEKWTTKEKFNAFDLSTIEPGTEYNLTGAIEEGELDSALQTKINGKLTAPTTPTAESAVTMLADGTVGTKPLSEFGGGGGSSVTVDSALSSTSENPVQNKVINSALNGKYEKPSGGIPKTDLDSSVQTSLGKADTALQTHQTITTGSANGTISVGGTNVAVKGLGTAAYKADTYFATAAQVNTNTQDISDLKEITGEFSARTQE